MLKTASPASSLLFLLCAGLWVACSSTSQGKSSDDPARNGDGDGDVAGDGDGDGDGDSVGTGGNGGTGGDSNNGGPTFKNTPANKRVVAYLPTYRNLNPAGVDFGTITHLCIAFANPGPSGVEFDAQPHLIHALVEAAHENGVYVLASIAGAAGGQAVEDAIQPGVVDGFVTALLDLMDRYDLDGIDVDIEGNHVNNTYEPFVLKLSAAMPAGKLLTAAVATWNGSDFSDTALAEYDFINLMSYDHCGSWSAACEHSTYEDAVSELNYWENTRGLGAGTVTLGVPFYGYCWGEACPSTALTYGEILAGYPEATTSDYLVGEGYTISFNGASTIAQKATLAGEHGGIMIWEIGQDAGGEDSLLGVIAENWE